MNEWDVDYSEVGMTLTQANSTDTDRPFLHLHNHSSSQPQPTINDKTGFMTIYVYGHHLYSKKIVPH